MKWEVQRESVCECVMLVSDNDLSVVCLFVCYQSGDTPVADASCRMRSGYSDWNAILQVL